MAEWLVRTRDFTQPRKREWDTRQQGRRVRCTDTLIVKLRGTADATPRFAAATDSRAETSFLARLVDNGHVRHVTPVFVRDRAAPGARLALAAAANEESRRSVARGLVNLQLDPATDADRLAAHLSSLREEVEYAFVPAVKHYFGAGARKSSQKTGPDPLASRQWAHGAVRIHDARARAGFVEADKIVVAVVDSGIDQDHPDLKGSIKSYTTYVVAEDKRDLVGHGTHVAGIIAAGLNNAVGVAGLCRARIMVVKGLPAADDAYVAAEYYRALAHPIDHGAKVINLSLGAAAFDPAEQEIVQEALSAGIVVVAAMGNEFQTGNPVEYPAAYKGVIAVGASDELDRRADFSNTGKHISLVAPGVNVLSTTPRYPSRFADKLSYDAWPGTSMATPHVAAAAALLLARKPTMKPAQVRKRLMATADRAPGQAKRPNEEYGWGRLNVAKALS